ncbi:unnamed protein product [Acanthoscelides obtectus]|uniref:Platelet-derived growth factor (PDGF) family profile domain-containing protein n=1 Tax=Acanthoscelides obtectus TaxID=200917 RepID=A0A9P0P6X1_ACAOB|nr:unnamed protein product [Acanthoscelides obtectus]CAK1631780.1 Platelet-derived growth factor subunit B [Acanthoscelides obtectus]
MWYSIDSVVLLSSCLLVLLDSVKGQDRNRNEQAARIIYPNDDDFPHNHQHHSHGGFPPGFQHSPEFHKNDGKCCKQFITTQQPRIDVTRTSTRKPPDPHTNVALTDLGIEAKGNTSLQIPLDLALRISEVDNITELFNYVEDDDDIDGTPFIMNRFGDGARNAAIVPKPAGCQPEKVSVKLGTDTDPSILYMPPCTRIERCGGCCSHPLLECQPIDTETIAFQVKKTKYVGNNKLKVISKEVVLVDRHVSCKCGCITKAKDCNKYQEYREAECRCACVNTDEARKCINDPQKLWNPKICSCQCREVQECTTGYSFDQRQCKCLPSTLKRRFTLEQAVEPSDYDRFY